MLWFFIHLIDYCVERCVRIFRTNQFSPAIFRFYSLSYRNICDESSLKFKLRLSSSEITFMFWKSGIEDVHCGPTILLESLLTLQSCVSRLASRFGMPQTKVYPFPHCLKPIIHPAFGFSSRLLECFFSTWSNPSYWYQSRDCLIWSLFMCWTSSQKSIHI
jgi:hypothetical protein